MSTAQNQAYKKIRKAILAGEYPPGSQLRQEELAAKFDMSRTSVRYAIQTLADEGLVEIGDTRRSFVANVSMAFAEESYDILAMLEPYSAGLAAEHATDDDISELWGLIEQMAGVIDNDDDDIAFLDINSQFHRKIHEMSGNRTLKELIDRIVEFPQTLYLKLGKSTESAGANDDHRRIVAAIERRDKALAAMEMKAHIEYRRRESRELWSESARD